MDQPSHIPVLGESSFDGALLWFSQLQCADLLFHPEDDPEQIVLIESGEKMFSPMEVEYINEVLDKLESDIGHEKTIAAAYPVFMSAMGIMLDS